MDLEKLQNKKLEAYSRENEKDEVEQPDEIHEPEKKPKRKGQFYYAGTFVLDSPDFTGGIDYRRHDD